MDKTANPGINCSVQQCAYHTTDNKCTASKIEVGSSKTCCSSCDTECVHERSVVLGSLFHSDLKSFGRRRRYLRNAPYDEAFARYPCE